MRVAANKESTEPTEEFLVIKLKSSIRKFYGRQTRCVPFVAIIVSITADIVSSNLDQDEVYKIMW
jgi:hypothetical protein